VTRCNCCVSEEHHDPYGQLGIELGPLSTHEDHVACPTLTGAYQIRVRPNGEPLGLDYEYTGCGLMVKTISAGAFRMHNVCSPNTAHVYRRDFITSINGKCDLEAVAEELEFSQDLKLDMIHPKTWRVHVNTRSKPIGVELHAYDQDSTVLEVRKITKGVLKSQNEVSERDRVIKVGDLIYRVNDTAGNQVQMLQEMNVRAVLQLDLLRVNGMLKQCQGDASKANSRSASRSASKSSLGSKSSSKSSSRSPSKSKSSLDNKPTSPSSDKPMNIFGSFKSRSKSRG